MQVGVTNRRVEWENTMMEKLNTNSTNNVIKLNKTQIRGRIGLTRSDIRLIVYGASPGVLDTFQFIIPHYFAGVSRNDNFVVSEGFHSLTLCCNGYFTDTKLSETDQVQYLKLLFPKIWTLLNRNPWFFDFTYSLEPIVELVLAPFVDDIIYEDEITYDTESFIYVPTDFDVMVFRGSLRMTSIIDDLETISITKKMFHEKLRSTGIKMQDFMMFINILFGRRFKQYLLECPVCPSCPLEYRHVTECPFGRKKKRPGGVFVYLDGKLIFVSALYAKQQLKPYYILKKSPSDRIYCAIKRGDVEISSDSIGDSDDTAPCKYTLVISGKEQSITREGKYYFYNAFKDLADYNNDLEGFNRNLYARNKTKYKPKIDPFTSNYYGSSVDFDFTQRKIEEDMKEYKVNLSEQQNEVNNTHPSDRFHNKQKLNKDYYNAIRCFNCDDAGHYARECPLPKNYRKLNDNYSSYHSEKEKFHKKKEQTKQEKQRFADKNKKSARKNKKEKNDEYIRKAKNYRESTPSDYKPTFPIIQEVDSYDNPIGNALVPYNGVGGYVESESSVDEIHIPPDNNNNNNNNPPNDNPNDPPPQPPDPDDEERYDDVPVRGNMPSFDMIIPWDTQNSQSLFNWDNTYLSNRIFDFLTSRIPVPIALKFLARIWFVRLLRHPTKNTFVKYKYLYDDDFHGIVNFDGRTDMMKKTKFEHENPMYKYFLVYTSTVDDFPLLEYLRMDFITHRMKKLFVSGVAETLALTLQRFTNPHESVRIMQAVRLLGFDIHKISQESFSQIVSQTNYALDANFQTNWQRINRAGSQITSVNIDRYSLFDDQLVQHNTTLYSFCFASKKTKEPGFLCGPLTPGQPHLGSVSSDIVSANAGSRNYRLIAQRLLLASLLLCMLKVVLVYMSTMELLQGPRNLYQMSLVHYHYLAGYVKGCSSRSLNRIQRVWLYLLRSLLNSVKNISLRCHPTATYLLNRGSLKPIILSTVKLSFYVSHLKSKIPLQSLSEKLNAFRSLNHTLHISTLGVSIPELTNLRFLLDQSLNSLKNASLSLSGLLRKFPTPYELLTLMKCFIAKVLSMVRPTTIATNATLLN